MVDAEDLVLVEGRTVSLPSTASASRTASASGSVLSRQPVAGAPDYPVALREQAFTGQVEERGQDLAAREVARGAEDDDHVVVGCGGEAHIRPRP
jgi:hypothetical protein